MGRLEEMMPGQSDEVLAYLERRPYENVYVAWVIATRQVVRGEILVWRDAAGSIAGVCYLGPQIVLCAQSDAALEAFAQRSRRARAARMIAGPRRAVERFWIVARTWMPVPSSIRARQPVYALERRGLLTAFRPAGTDIGRATRDELDEIAANWAQMIAGEIGGDARRAGAEFRGRTARIIDAGWWWRSRFGGRLAFMCNIGAATPQTAQLHGVWSPPDMRGAGHATTGLAGICDRLLDEFATLCLYVNDFNAPAIALYERVGFTRAGEFQTILFD